MKTLHSLILLLTLAACAAPSQPPATATSSAEVPRVPTSTVEIIAPSASLTPSPSPTPLPTATLTPTPSAGGQSAGDWYAPELGNTGYDVQHYTLALTLDPGLPTVTGAATINAISTIHNLASLSLDFSGFEISSLTVDGLPAEYTRDPAKLHILLPESPALGQEFEIAIAYAGEPAQTSSAYVPFFHHLGLQYLGSNLFALNEPDGAHYWFPCNDTPTDKAAFTFEITAPAGLEAIANGALVRELSGTDSTTYLWEQPYPMATYLATVAIGDYEFITDTSPAGIPIEHYIFADIRQPFTDAADVTGEALDWMSELFGDYPFDTFGFVTTRLIRASLETQGRVLLSENMLNEETVIHEIAHMWFGDWVTMESWSDMWHNEGFAVYVSLMWQTREQPGALNIFMQNMEADVTREGSADPLGDLAPHRLFGFDSYQRGALLIHNLRLTVGDDAFFTGLRLYFELYGGGTASRQEFIAVMEEASGMELDAFFAEWLE